MLGLNLDLSLTQSFGSRVSAIKRYFTKFNASLNQYIDLSSAIVLDGDFKIDVTCVMESSGTTTLMGLSDSGFSRLQRVATASTSTIRFRMSGYNVDLADDIVTTDGKLRKHTFTRVGDTFSYYEDDVLVDSTIDVGADGRSLGINCLGQSNDFNYIDSYYSNFVIEKGGVVVLDMDLDEDGTNDVVYNKAAILGEESWSFNNPVIPDGLAEQFALIDGGYGNWLEEDKQYLVNASWGNLTGRLGFLIGDQAINTEVEVNGSGSISFVATTETNRRLGLQEKQSTPSTADFVYISVKEIPSTTPYGTRINMTSANTELFTWYDEYNSWIGSENLWTYGDYTFTGSEGSYVLLNGSFSSTLVTPLRSFYWEWVPSFESDATSGAINFVIDTSVDLVYHDTVFPYSNSGVKTISIGGTTTLATRNSGINDPMTGSITGIVIKNALGVPV